MDTAYSVNDIPIRLTKERWFHITENHDDLAGYYDDVLHTIENPDLVVQGYGGALVVVKGVGKSGRAVFNVSTGRSARAGGCDRSGRLAGELRVRGVRPRAPRLDEARCQVTPPQACALGAKT